MHVPMRPLPLCAPSLPPAGKYVTGDINEAYLRNLEEQGRGKRRGGARPGRKASLIGGNGAGAKKQQPASAGTGTDRLPASTSA